MKRGFTLIETVVTVGIIAAMAAVVIPQVARQFDAADPTRIQNDLKNLQAAVEAYSVNLKQGPGDLDDLANSPGAQDSSLIGTDALATQPAFTNASFWKGPYIDVAVPDSTYSDATITTGYGALILDSFVCFAAGNNFHGISEGTAATTPNGSCPASSTGQKFVAFQITGIACPATVAGSTFETLNALFDGTEVTPKVSGRIRCDDGNDFTTNPDKNVVYFLAVPIS